MEAQNGGAERKMTAVGPIPQPLPHEFVRARKSRPLVAGGLKSKTLRPNYGA